MPNFTERNGTIESESARFSKDGEALTDLAHGRTAVNKAYSFFADYFKQMNQKICSISSDELMNSVALINKVSEEGKKLLIVGNGGSAAMASHLSVDFLKSAGVRAMNFNEADLITCFSNDYGYDEWVAKAFEMYADAGDLAIIISSSGQSPNMLRAAEKAREMNLHILSVTGFKEDNPLRKMGDINLWVDSTSYNIVEMTHHVWLLSIVDYMVAAKETL